MKYIIGTGWWCDGTGVHSHSKHQQYVDTDTRKKPFFELWYKSVMKYTSPQKIIVIDSASPIKPDLAGKNNVSFYSLDQNFGAEIDGTRKQRLSGWSRGVLASASLAFLEDCDYYVYVEQDSLIHGKGLIEYAINKMENKPVMLGSGKGTPQPLQQSFIIIKKEFIPTLLYAEMTHTKKELTVDSEKRYSDILKGNYNFLPFGYGRQRPINFNDQFFYAQHLRTDELEKFKRLLS